MADLDSLIGCKISLISLGDIRYDGTLFSINQAESSLVLKDVQSFGTENRVTDPSKKMSPNSSTVPFVTFPGSEIKDLYVHEDAVPATPAPAPAPVVAAPAPVVAAPAPVVQKPKQHEHKHEKPHQQHQKKTEAAPAAPVIPAAPVVVVPPAPPAQEKQPAVTREHVNKSSTVGTGSHLLKLREKKAGDALSNQVNTKQDFNFEAGLQTFKKDDMGAEIVADAAAHKYVKDDFFDNFSADIAEDGKKHRMTASQERVLNQDTFGAVALSGGYRRGGRGGGRGNGNGRGGNYNNNNNGTFNNSGRNSGRGGGRGRGRHSSNNNNATTATPAN